MQANKAKEFIGEKELAGWIRNRNTCSYPQKSPAANLAERTSLLREYSTPLVDDGCAAGYDIGEKERRMMLSFKVDIGEKSCFRCSCHPRRTSLIDKSAIS